MLLCESFEHRRHARTRAGIAILRSSGARGHELHVACNAKRELTYARHEEPLHELPILDDELLPWRLEELRSVWPKIILHVFESEDVVGHHWSWRQPFEGSTNNRRITAPRPPPAPNPRAWRRTPECHHSERPRGQSPSGPWPAVRASLALARLLACCSQRTQQVLAYGPPPPARCAALYKSSGRAGRSLTSRRISFFKSGLVRVTISAGSASFISIWIACGGHAGGVAAQRQMAKRPAWISICPAACPCWASPKISLIVPHSSPRSDCSSWHPRSWCRAVLEWDVLML